MLESLVALAIMMIVLLAIGALIGASGVGFWPIWWAAAFGAGLGDGVSYWIGQRVGNRVWCSWPLSRSPGLLPRARTFFARWGVASVFIGRFFGPLRATIPLVAGASAMPFGRFQAANFSSALLWAAAMLVPGALGVPWIQAN